MRGEGSASQKSAAGTRGALPPPRRHLAPATPRTQPATQRTQPATPRTQPAIPHPPGLPPSPGLPTPLAGPAYPLRQASFQRIAAASRHERCVIIYDRGVLDVAAFLPREQWGGARRLEPSPSP